MINNRQAGRRNRGRNNNNNGRPNNGGNRGGGDTGNRIDNRARGNATQLLEKYKNMARDAQMAGDRVNAEYYLQFADHYFRVLADNRARQEEQQANQPQRHRRPDENFDEDGDDFEGVADGVDEFRTDSSSYDRTPREQPDRAPREQAERAPRDYGDRAPRDNDRAPRDFDRAPRDNDRAPRDQGDRPQRDFAPRDQNRRQDEVREDRSREDRGPRRDRPRRDRPVFAEAQPQVEQAAPAPVAAPVVEAAPVQQAPAPQMEEAPRPRRGRPRKVVDVAASEAPVGLDMAILPPSIARADNDSDVSEDAPKKRTRRPRATTEAAE